MYFFQSNITNDLFIFTVALYKLFIDLLNFVTWLLALINHFSYVEVTKGFRGPASVFIGNSVSAYSLLIYI